MILSRDSILNVRLVTNWRQSVNSLWGKGKAEKWRGFFFTFFSQEKKFRIDRIRSPIETAWWVRAQHFDHYTKLSGCKWRFRRCIYTREPNSSFSPARWQRDWPLSLDNTFETDSTCIPCGTRTHFRRLRRTATNLPTCLMHFKWTFDVDISTPFIFYVVEFRICWIYFKLSKLSYPGVSCQGLVFMYGAVWTT